MKTLLHIDASANTKASVSRALCAGFAADWLKADSGNKVVYRDLNADPVPVVTSDLLEAIYAPAGEAFEPQRTAQPTSKRREKHLARPGKRHAAGGQRLLARSPSKARAN